MPRSYRREWRDCWHCGVNGHLEHYCPQRHHRAPSGSNTEWLDMTSAKTNDEIVQDLFDLILTGGKASQVKVLCKFCSDRPYLLDLANTWRTDEGHSLLSTAIVKNARSIVQMLWSAGISHGIDRKSDNYILLMKMCDVINYESNYDWFIGNNEFAKRLTREHGMVGAHLRVTLVWNSIDDLDLHVWCPSGQQIYFSHKESTCGGKLDVDMNAGAPFSATPVENIVWLRDAPSGQYKVTVNNYCHRSGAQRIPFRVEVATSGEQPVHIDGVWQKQDGEKNYEEVYAFELDQLGDQRQLDALADEPIVVGDQTQLEALADEPIVVNMNKLAGMGTVEEDKLSQLVWLVLRGRDEALFDLCLSLELQSPGFLLQETCVSPQWCFLQAIWAKNLAAADKLLGRCGNEINVNYKYKWDVIPWDETIAQTCWRECHGDPLHDRPWMNILAWLARHGADFSQVKLNFHRWRKPVGVQESQIRSFTRLIWHLSDENGWTDESKNSSDHLVRAIRQLVYWGAHIPEDLDPNFKGEIGWGVNGKRPKDADPSYEGCHGRLNLELAHAAVRAGRSSNHKQIISVLCSFRKACPDLTGSLRRHILQFIHPTLACQRFAYQALQTSEGGVTRNIMQKMFSDDASVPPRGYVCPRCRQGGHWKHLCPRG